MNFQSKNKPIMLGALMPDEQLPEWSSLNTSYISGEETKREAQQPTVQEARRPLILEPRRASANSGASGLTGRLSALESRRQSERRQSDRGLSNEEEKKSSSSPMLRKTDESIESKNLSVPPNFNTLGRVQATETSNQLLPT